MKKLFDKSNFTLSSFDEKQKRQSLILSILVIVSFVIAAFVEMDALYAFSDIVGCFVSSSPDVAIKDIFHYSYHSLLQSGLSFYSILHLEEQMKKNGERN